MKKKSACKDQVKHPPGFGNHDRAWKPAQLAAMLAPKLHVQAMFGDKKTIQAISSSSTGGALIGSLDRDLAYEILLVDAAYLLDAAERRHRMQFPRWRTVLRSTWRCRWIWRRRFRCLDRW